MPRVRLSRHHSHRLEQAHLCLGKTNRPSSVVEMLLHHKDTWSTRFHPTPFSQLARPAGTYTSSLFCCYPGDVWDVPLSIWRICTLVSFSLLSYKLRNVFYPYFHTSCDYTKYLTLWSFKINLIFKIVPIIEAVSKRLQSMNKYLILFIKAAHVILVFKTHLW